MSVCITKPARIINLLELAQFHAVGISSSKRKLYLNLYTWFRGFTSTEIMNFNNTFTTVHLRQAIVTENLEQVKLILDHGVKVTPADYSEYHQEHSSSPLRFYPLESQDTDDKIEILKVLLNAGASLAVFCHNADNTMIYRLLSGGKRRTIDTVLEYKNDFFEKFHGGNTMLHYLAANDDSDIVNVLRGRKFNVNLPNDKGHTSLLNAVRCGNSKVVEFLFKNGANLVKSTNYLKIAWESFNLPKNHRKKDNFVDIIRLLLEHGTKPWLPDQYFLISVVNDFLEPIFAHIALQQLLHENLAAPFILAQIKSSELFKNHFESFLKKFEELKKVTVYKPKSFTLYNLLIQSVENISLYVCNEEFNWNSDTGTNNFPLLDTSYYMKIIRNKVDKAIELVKTREECISIISKIAGFHCDAYPHIIFKIFDLLDYQDLQNLILAATGA